MKCPTGILKKTAIKTLQLTNLQVHTLFATQAKPGTQVNTNYTKKICL